MLSVSFCWAILYHCDDIFQCIVQKFSLYCELCMKLVKVLNRRWESDMCLGGYAGFLQSVTNLRNRPGYHPPRGRGRPSHNARPGYHPPRGRGRPRHNAVGFSSCCLAVNALLRLVSVPCSSLCPVRDRLVRTCLAGESGCHPRDRDATHPHAGRSSAHVRRGGALCP